MAFDFHAILHTLLGSAPVAFGFLTPAPRPLAGAPDLEAVQVFQPDGTPVVMVQPPDIVPLAKEATLQTVEADLQAMEATLQTLGTEATLVTVAKEATQQTVLQTVETLPQAATKGNELYPDVTAALVDYAVPMGAFAVVTRIRLPKLAGTTLTVKLGGAGQPEITLEQGFDLDGLAITPAMGLYLNSPGAAGASATLQLFGR
ncbi:MAG TPA: hypothetical protein VFT46_07170 [Holophagaceae bacterium]|nr:hypothetical protein [Holophagaceae bacterium]